jgi:UDP-2-acetamido-2-deoxy-ribo-hexuluronate aminotransferase
VVVDEREQVQAALRAAGIPTSLHNPAPLHRQSVWARAADADSCPVAHAMAGKVLSLPMGPYLDDAGARRVGEALLRAAGVAMPGAADAARAYAGPLPASF